MPSHKGSAAVAIQAAPESAEALSIRRQRLRSELPLQFDQAERTMRLARQALTGPDPEAALEYLRLLGRRVASMRRQHR